MRYRFPLLVALALATACSSDPVAPVASTDVDQLSVDLTSQFEGTRGAAIDRGGIGGVEFPDSLKLSTEQKAQIEALHVAFETANAADLRALKAIEAEAKAAIKANKTREEVRAILEKAAPIRARLAVAFAKLGADIWKVYTPAQQAWITSRKRSDAGECRADAANVLTTAQVEQIRQLKSRFAEAVKPHLETIKKAHEAARAAKAAGATAEEIRRILAAAEPAMTAVQKAERDLKAAILALLTEEQRNNRCLLRILLG